MKILIPVLHYSPVFGGLETWTQNIAERLAKNFEILVITGKVNGQAVFEVKNGVKISRTSLFTLKNLSHSSLIYILTTLPFIFLKSLNLIRKQKINLLHCHGFLSSFLGYLLFELTETPYIVTVQGLEKGKGFLRKLIYRNARVCIGASMAIKRNFEALGVRKIRIIPNGINLERFKNLSQKGCREKLGLKNEFLIISVAVLEKRKGIRYLIKALEILGSRFKVQGSRLLIVGDGSKKKNLEELVKYLNLDDKVKFLGQIPNEKIPEYLSAADCFVLPSLTEGFGIVILEAQAAGIPVVASRVGGILDLIQDGNSGILVSPKDPLQIAEAIYRIYSQPDFARNLIQKARENLRKYNWDVISEEVKEIYKNLILAQQ